MSTEQLTQLEKVYIKFKELKEKAKIDTTLDKTNLDSAFNCTMSLTTWITTKTEWQGAYRNFEAKRKLKYRELYQFYYTEFSLKLNNKSEYDLFIESDTKYVDYINLCLTTKEILEFIDGIILTIKNKQFEIKHYLEFLRFQNGQ